MAKKSNALYWVIGAIVAIVIIGGGFGLFSGNNKSCSSNSQCQNLGYPAVCSEGKCYATGGNPSCQNVEPKFIENYNLNEVQGLGEFKSKSGVEYICRYSTRIDGTKLAIDCGVLAWELSDPPYSNLLIKDIILTGTGNSPSLPKDCLDNLNSYEELNIEVENRYYKGVIYYHVPKDKRSFICNEENKGIIIDARLQNNEETIKNYIDRYYDCPATAD